MYDPPPSKVVYIYKEHNSQLDELANIEGLSVELVRGTNLDKLLDKLKPVEGEMLVAIDDAMLECAKSQTIADLVMRGRHR